MTGISYMQRVSPLSIRKKRHFICGCAVWLKNRSHALSMLPSNIWDLWHLYVSFTERRQDRKKYTNKNLWREGDSSFQANIGSIFLYWLDNVFGFELIGFIFLRNLYPIDVFELGSYFITCTTSIGQKHFRSFREKGNRKLF